MEEVRLKNGETTSKSVIPNRYANADTSGIVMEISGGGNRAIKLELVDVLNHPSRIAPRFESCRLRRTR